VSATNSHHTAAILAHQVHTRKPQEEELHFRHLLIVSVRALPHLVPWPKHITPCCHFRRPRAMLQLPTLCIRNSRMHTHSHMLAGYQALACTAGCQTSRNCPPFRQTALAPRTLPAAPLLEKPCVDPMFPRKSLLLVATDADRVTPSHHARTRTHAVTVCQSSNATTVPTAQNSPCLQQ